MGKDDKIIAVKPDTKERLEQFILRNYQEELSTNINRISMDRAIRDMLDFCEQELEKQEKKEQNELNIT